MRNNIIHILGFVILLVGLCVSSCSNPMSRYDKEIDNAEKIMENNPDSALSIIEAIDPSLLTQDSIKAKYYYVMASAHDRQGHIAFSDSLISFSNDYFRDKDLKRSIRSATLFAAYKFRIGEREAALRMLDSLSSLKNIPDSLLIESLRNRVNLGTYYGSNESLLRRLMAIDKDENWLPHYKYLLYFDFLFSGKNDSALVVLDEIIDMTAQDGEEEKKFRYKYEKMGVLEELERYAESISIADSLMNDPMGVSIKHYFHLWKSLTMLNMQNYASASAELAKADSLASAIPAEERGYFNSFAYVLHAVLDYRSTAKVSLIPLARINNPQRDNLFDAQHLRQEAAQRALEIENQRLILKAKNDRQTSMMVIIILVTLIISGLLTWYALNKRRKTLGVLERNEILQKLVDESKATNTASSLHETLRRAMLQQLGIIKMVAETPTEQNRDMLRKISSVEEGNDKSLVNWEDVYSMIDNLYSGFYSSLHERHGSVLTDKEEQIIALMIAGFSTKEISVVTGQTVATIYVRKSSVRKKLGVPEKEDIVAFLRHEAES